MTDSHVLTNQLLFVSQSLCSPGTCGYITQWWKTAGKGASMTVSCVQINQPLFVSLSLCFTWNLWLHYTVVEQKREGSHND